MRYGRVRCAAHHGKRECMLNKTIPVGVDGSSATITSYVFAPTEDAYALKPLPAVVVVPGGGYDHVSPRDGEPVALRLLAMGYQAFVLNYSVAPAVYPLALQELARAVDTVRSHATEFCVDPNRITVMGFSAGGHLVGLLGALWDKPWLAESIATSPESIRPDALCLGYPVVSSGAYAHRGSFEHLTGAGDVLAQKLSIENMVGEGFPRTFLWHTAEDASVPVQNSLLLAQALADHGIGFSLHVFPHGKHGASLATAQTAFKGCAEHIQPQVQGWPEQFAAWERDGR